MNVLHTADKHLTQVVQGTCRWYRDQCHSQGRSLVRFQRLRPRCVERHRLVGEVLHLHDEDVVQSGSADHVASVR